jgi:uncharacterized protein
MGLDIVKLVAETILSQTNSKRVTFVFFGGEPMLCGSDWYQKTIDIIENLAEKYYKNVDYGIQTNGTIFTESMIEIILKYRISISISLDGQEEYNRYRGGTDRVIANIKKLHKHHIYPAIIALIHPNNWNDISNIMHYFYSLNLYKIRFNTLRNIGKGETFKSLSDEEIYQAYVTIIETQMEINLSNSSRRINEKNSSEKVENFISYIQNGTVVKDGCSAFNCHGGREYIAISPFGVIYPCADVTYTRPNMILGRSLSTITSTSSFQTYSDFHFKSEWWEKCLLCDAKIICDFGCQAFIKEDEVFINSECEVTQKLYKYLNENREIILNFYC